MPRISRRALFRLPSTPKLPVPFAFVPVFALPFTLDQLFWTALILSLLICGVGAGLVRWIDAPHA